MLLYEEDLWNAVIRAEKERQQEGLIPEPSKVPHIRRTKMTEQRDAFLSTLSEESKELRKAFGGLTRREKE